MPSPHDAATHGPTSPRCLGALPALLPLLGALASACGGSVEAEDTLARAQATFDPAGTELWLDTLMGGEEPEEARPESIGPEDGPVGSDRGSSAAGDFEGAEAVGAGMPRGRSGQLPVSDAWRGPRPSDLELRIYARPSQAGTDAAEKLALRAELAGFEVEVIDAKQWRPLADESWLGDRTLDQLRRESTGLLLLPPGCASAGELLREVFGRGYAFETRSEDSRQAELLGEAAGTRIDVVAKRRVAKQRS